MRDSTVRFVLPIRPKRMNAEYGKGHRHGAAHPPYPTGTMHHRTHTGQKKGDGRPGDFRPKIRVQIGTRHRRDQYTQTQTHGPQGGVESVGKPTATNGDVMNE
eukprot:scaffold39087_cov183-Amphora_coffeaeformis.AAC.1